MPLPVAHSLLGFSLRQFQTLPLFGRTWRDVLFCVILANLPDIDFLPGLLVGNPNLHHQTYTHTLGAALFVGVVGGWFFARKYGGFWRYFLFVGLIYYSHNLLDFFNQDGRPPFGVMLFWPFSEDWFMSSRAFFSPVHKSSDSSTFFQSVFSLQNLFVAAKELLILTPVALVATIWRRRLNKKRFGSP